MENVRIVIVDDSPFSIAFIRDILESNNYEVVGTAGSLEEVIEVVTETKPDLVTMDMTLPGTDGLECTRAIHKIDENVKVIVVSSMMDDEIVADAKKNKVSGYIQKPVDSDELITIIKRVTDADGLYQFLKKEYFEVFKEALRDGLNKVSKNILEYKEEYSDKKEYLSEGVTVIIGIIGKCSGRMLLGLSQDAANQLSEAMLRRAPKSNDEVTAVLGEFANIVSGNACSILNKKNKALGLRVAPPTILFGVNVSISPPDFVTDTAIGEAACGKMLMNIGFKRGEDRWV